VLKDPKRLCKVIGIFVLYLGLLFCRGQWRINQLHREGELRRQKLAELTEYNTKLQKKLKTFQSDSYVEKVARSELGLVKKGEILYRMSGDERKPKAFQPVQSEVN
jgi:cell division protein FtsB